MKKIFYILVSLFITTSVAAQGRVQDSLWQSANDNYAMGDFNSAIEDYNAIVEGGFESAKLYYNLGNSYYRVRNMGMAVVCYKRALKLEPSNRDAKANLAMAKARCVDKIEQVPEFMVVTWIKSIRDSLSSNSWAIITLIGLFLLSILFLLFRFSRNRGGAKLSFILSLIILCAVIISLLFSLSAYNKAKGGDDAVVISAVGSVKSSPSQDGSPVFILHEGTEVEILETLEGWSKIEISDGRQGWMKNSELEVI